MEKEEYHKKCLALLQPPTYMPLPAKDPTKKVERRVTEVLKQLQEEEAIEKTLFDKLRPNLCRAPRFYGLPKIHKPNNPLRPIVSAIGSPTYHLAKFITSNISPLMGNTSSFVKNAKHFSDMVSSESVTEQEAMVSFDVQSLFTNVPIDKALEVINRRLAEDETLEDRSSLTPGQVTMLLGICLKTTYFMYHQQFYEKAEGAAMGSPVSPVVANIFMEFMEEVAISTSPSPVRFWKRYVDDTFCFLQKTAVDEVLQHLNTISPTIKFTVEQEKDGQLPFLDALVFRKEDGSLEIGVHRKPTHTDRHLPYRSHHPPHVKKGVVRTMIKRARDITTEDHLLHKELRHLRMTLPGNGYPKNWIKLDRYTGEENGGADKTDEEEQKPLATATIPYIQGLSENIRRLLRDYNIRTAFKSSWTLGRLLTKVKDPVPPEERTGVVYKIGCICGDVYIGETSRSMSTRIKEHKAACRLGKFERSAVAEHAWQDGHSIEWDNAEILDTATGFISRRTKEALHIKLRTTPTCRMNRDEGRDLSPIWLSTLRDVTKLGEATRPRLSRTRSQQQRSFQPHRVSNRKGQSMQNKFVSVVSSRPTLGKIETTLQIGYALRNVREKAILNHKPKYKKWLRDQNYVHRGRRTSCQVYHF